jgi:hypothetical protein
MQEPDWRLNRLVQIYMGLTQQSYETIKEREKGNEKEHDTTLYFKIPRI